MKVVDAAVVVVVNSSVVVVVGSSVVVVVDSPVVVVVVNSSVVVVVNSSVVVVINSSVVVVAGSSSGVVGTNTARISTEGVVVIPPDMANVLKEPILNPVEPAQMQERTLFAPVIAHVQTSKFCAAISSSESKKSVPPGPSTFAISPV
jgi:hypothetical protein